MALELSLLKGRQPVGGQDRLFVVSGVQRGASVPLGDGALTLGAAGHCDIALLADEVRETVVSVDLTDARLIRLTVIEGALRLGERTLRKGRSLSVGRHIPIEIGAIKLVAASSLEEADRVLRARRRRATQVSWAACLALAVGATGVVVASDHVRSPAPERAAVTETGGASLGFMPLHAAAVLRERLADAGLDGLHIETDRSGGVLAVRGSLRPSDRPRWAEVYRWFEAAYAPDIQLEAYLDEARENVTLPFSVESVWMSPAPRLTLHDGSQGRVGDILPGGWRLDAIEPGRVAISRNGETLVLTL